MNQELLQHLSQQLQNINLLDSDIRTVTRMHGGSVNQSYKLEGEAKQVFVKVNDKKAFPGMFDKEKRSLEFLTKKTGLRIPLPLLQGDFKNYSYLILEFIQEETKASDFWKKMGEGIASLHKSTSLDFGFEENNYNGSLIQINEPKSNWFDFFIENRLIVQEKMAVDKGLIDNEVSSLLNRFYPRLETLFPIEKPALLHGDFWSGNFMTDENGEPVIMDPAVYYGHREMDISMSMLFGGFKRDFFEHYNATYPLEKGWEERVDICNLYPLMVHVNLFGAAYAQRVKSILKRLVL